MSFDRLRTSKSAPLNTFVNRPKDATDTSTAPAFGQHPFYEYIPFRINYDDLTFASKVPSSFRWTDKYLVSPLDQGSCGSCWAFASCASLTDRFNIGCDRKVFEESLSPTVPLTCNFFLEAEQERIFDINYVNTIANLRNIIDNLACHGNSLVLTCFFLHTWGTFRQSCVSYRSGDVLNTEYRNTNFGYRSSQVITSNINFSSTGNTITCAAMYGNVGRSVNVSACFGRIVNDGKIYIRPAQTFRSLLYYAIENCVQNNETIMRDILTFGPVCSSFRVYADFYDFDPVKDGVYTSNQDPATLVGGHAICIVGWGEYRDPTTNERIPFWWIKNSWGTNYGLNGYFRMRRGVNHCGLEENVVGMIPNYFPTDIAQLHTVVDHIKNRWKFKPTLHPLYKRLLTVVLSEYTLIPDDMKKIMFTNAIVTKYPIIDYFFFNMPFRALFHLDPANGYSMYNTYQFPGLDYSAPFSFKDCRRHFNIV